MERRATVKRDRRARLSPVLVSVLVSVLISVLVSVPFVPLSPAVAAACCPTVLVSPPALTDGIRNADLRWAILTELYQAKESVDVAMYSLTDPGLAWALIDLHEKGVKVRVYLDKQEAGIKASKDEVLVDNGIAVKLDDKSGLMHHKFAVIDGQAVITGSYNWTQAAEDVNLENMLILRCGCLSSEFSQRFAEYWSGR